MEDNMDNIEVQQINRTDASILIVDRKIKLFTEMSEHDRIMEYCRVYKNYLAICNDNKFDEEINSLDNLD
jgi:hypothetical protein